MAAEWAGQAVDICSAPFPGENKQLQSLVGPTGCGRKMRQVYLAGQGARTTQTPD